MRKKIDNYFQVNKVVNDLKCFSTKFTCKPSISGLNYHLNSNHRGHLDHDIVHTIDHEYIFFSLKRK